MPFLERDVRSVLLQQLQLNSWTSTAFVLLYIVTLLLSHVSQLVHAARIQTYTIFSELDGGGDRESFTDNIQDLFTVSKLVKEGRVKWKCIERGIWLEYSGVNYNFKNRNTEQFRHILHDGKCFSSNKTVQSIRHIGNSDLELPGISLYRHEDFTGEELYFDGTMLQLPVSITFQSFGFTGQESWTLYSGTDFSGEFNVCLQPKRIEEVVAKKDILDSQLILHIAHTRQALIVGSIRRGCGHHNGGGGGGGGGSGGGGYGHQHSVMHPQMTNKHRPFAPTPTLTLFSQVTARENLLAMDGTEVKLPGTGHTFVCFSIVGASNWTIFSGSEFNGLATCLHVQENTTMVAAAAEEHQHTHAYYGAPAVHQQQHAVGTPIENVTMGSEPLTFAVGSIRRGCDTDGKSGSPGSQVHKYALSIHFTSPLSSMAIIIVMATIIY